MNSRERFRAALKREIPDRIPRTDGFPWPDALARWRQEGLPGKASLQEYFNLDAVSGVRQCADLGFEPRVIEETKQR